MTANLPFQLLDPNLPVAERPARLQLLAKWSPPRALSSHAVAAASFVPGDDLVTAINVALRLGAPLLLTGEPGTGKTQAAHYVARYFGLEPDEGFFQVDIRSTSTAEELLYHFDQVAYFRSAYEAREGGAKKTPADFVVKGALWRALERRAPTVVLIDEIDKAPRDLPNDLLGVLDQRRFRCREYPEGAQWIAAPPDAPPPLVLITSNSERRLPEPFLRRCVFHHLELTEDLLRRAVAARQADFPALSERDREAALRHFLELRKLRLRKPPATAELLLWLVVLAGLPPRQLADLDRAPLSALPALGVLVKDREDLRLLR